MSCPSAVPKPHITCHTLWLMAKQHCVVNLPAECLVVGNAKKWGAFNFSALRGRAVFRRAHNTLAHNWAPAAHLWHRKTETQHSATLGGTAQNHMAPAPLIGLACCGTTGALGVPTPKSKPAALRPKLQPHVAGQWPPFWQKWWGCGKPPCFLLRWYFCS